MKKDVEKKQQAVKIELLKIARQRKVQLEQVLAHYAIERLLYRLSISKHKARFLLKGAMLFTAWRLSDFRTTRDLDLLGFGDNSVEAMKTVFVEVFSVDYSDDAITYLADSLLADEIRKDQEYVGVRIKCFAKLDTAKIPVQIDIVIGDAVYPAPAQISFPTLLEMPAPKLKAYKIETVVAEKLEAIVQHGMNNTRLKDYFDLWYLSSHFEFDGARLARAIAKTFERRKTRIDSDIPIGLSSNFYKNPTRVALWTPFAKKMENLAAGLSLKALVEGVGAFVLPPLRAALSEEKFSRRWKPNGPWKKILGSKS